MAIDPKENISSRSSQKKHGALYHEDTEHVESQDKVEKGSGASSQKSSEEE